MINSSLKGTINQLWLEFHSGGITNPLTVIEQISYLMFARMLDVRELRKERSSRHSKKQYENRIFPPDKQHLRWSHIYQLGADDQLKLVHEELFPFFRTEMVKTTTLGRYLQDAQCIIQKASLLKSAINTINELPLLEGDTKGDLYEYLLSKLTTAGVAGQFRTPRHIIRAMVEMVDVKPTEMVCDPACGTGGFLIETMEYLRRTHSSPELVHDDIDETNGELAKDAHGNRIKVYPGDLLEDYLDHIQNDMFHGFDFDNTMLRIAAMNMLLHGIDAPAIEYQDTLSDTFPERFKDSSENAFDVVLANPPFKGSIDSDSVHKGLMALAKTSKTELLFLVLMQKMLKVGGRCAVIVPDGVLFGTSNAHLAVRRMLIEENQVQAIVSLPSGVFKPYAGVSTAVLLFTKGGITDNVWFYRVENDGYSLDDKRAPVEDSDLPDLVTQWQMWNGARKDSAHQFEDRKQNTFYVPKAEISAKGFDLSLNRYGEKSYKELNYEKPRVILSALRKLEKDILDGLDELESMLT